MMALNEQNLLELRCKLEYLITRREAMIATNQICLIKNVEPLVSSFDFFGLAEEIKYIENEIVRLGEK